MLYTNLLETNKLVILAEAESCMLTSRQHQIMEVIASCLRQYYIVKQNCTFCPELESLVASTDILL